MAGSIKGIIVEIGGDTSRLQNALKKVNSSTSSLSRELRGINSLLKLDPKNTELLAQKQTVLTEKIETTEEKLKMLKETKEKADKAMAEGTEINEENYRNLQREIINTENQLKQLKVEASKWTKAGTVIENIGNKVQTVGGKVGNLGSTLTKTVTPAVAGLTTLAIKSFDDVDAGLDIVIKKTGATADAAVDLEEVYKEVAGNVAGSFEDVGSAVGEINTRFGFTNEVLEEASEKFLKFAKVNDIDVNEAVQKVSRYMGDASIESYKYGEVLDSLTSVAQASGISIGTLTEYLTKYGAPMRALGLDTKESIAIFAGWEKAGVNTEIAFSGMKKAIGTWGKEGKDATKEFKKTLEEIKKCPDIASATTKAIEVFGQKAGPDLADAIKGGRFEYSEFLDILEKSDGVLNETYSNIMDETDEAQISMKKLKIEFAEVGKEILSSAYPAVEDILKVIKDLINKFNKLDPEMKKNILKYIALAAAMGPVLKIGGNIITLTGKGISSLGNLAKTVAEVKNGMTVANNATGLLAKGLSALTTPIGATVAGVTLATGIIVAEISKTESKIKDNFQTMGDAAVDFYNDLQSAEGYLSDFNNTMFASTEEQENLEKQMDEIQAGITKICKTAADERRGYTQQEITQLNEYFTKLRELKDREIEIYQSRIDSITQLAEAESSSFQGTIEEYQERGTQWIATAKQQAQELISVAENRRIEEIAALNEMYSEEERLTNQNYKDSVAAAEQKYQDAVAAANKQVGEVSSIYANGYAERANQDGDFAEHVKHYHWEQKEENKRYAQELDAINNNIMTSEEAKQQQRGVALSKHKEKVGLIWQDMYKNMSKSESDQMGSWIGMITNAEMYGGKLSDENQEIVDTILESYDHMPKDAREDMKNTMEEMLNQMTSSERGLFTKASGIAGGIISRLKASFNVDTSSLPGHKSGLDYVPYDNYIARLHKGERVLTAEENKQLMQMEKASKLRTPNMKAIGNSVVDSMKTVFTTPNITFNVQKMDEANLNSAFNYINRRLGSQY